MRESDVGLVSAFEREIVVESEKEITRAHARERETITVADISTYRDTTTTHIHTHLLAQRAVHGSVSCVGVALRNELLEPLCEVGSVGHSLALELVLKFIYHMRCGGYACVHAGTTLGSCNRLHLRLFLPVQGLVGAGGGGIEAVG